MLLTRIITALCLLLVILPMALISLSLVQEAAQVYERMRSGQLNFGSYAQQIFSALPEWATQLLAHFHLSSLSELQEKFSSAAVQASQFLATKALNIGQDTLGFIVSVGIMLYLLLRKNKYEKHSFPLKAEEYN